MSNSKRLWTKIVRFLEALEGMDDPMGDYIFSLATRVEKLERDLDHLKKQLHSCPDGSPVAGHAEN